MALHPQAGGDQVGFETVCPIEPLGVGDDQHLLSSLWQRRGNNDDRVALSSPEGSSWQPMSRGELTETVSRVAAGLIALGIEPGDRVVIMSSTRIEWTIADLAILAAGGVTVPIYDTSSADQCRSIVADSTPRLAFAANDEVAQLLSQARTTDGRPDRIITFDGGGLDEVAAGGDAHRDEVERRVAAIRGSDLASIVYTSGTTGDPKGCELTHHNLVWTARQTLHRMDFITKDDTTLLFLPMAHIFTRLVQYVCLEAEVNTGFARSLDHLSDDLRTFHPTFLLAVPRVFEKVFQTAQHHATGVRSKVFDFAVESGVRWSSSESPGLLLRLRRGLSDRLVYSKLRDAIGGNVRFCVSGGAALNPRLGHFFNAAGVTILEGYGLTETSAPAALNIPTEMRIGTVGRPLPGVAIQLADDGEILIRGDNVFAAYHNNDAATRETFQDDWLRTGDVGVIDADGYVVITDRKKELIVTANGKNVAPGPLEQRVREHRLISNVMVIGNDRPFVAALVTLDPDELSDFATAHGITNDDPEHLCRDVAVVSEVSRAIDTANEAVSRAESIREFRILVRDFSQDADELTQTLKLRRRDIAANFASEIDSIYASSG